MELRTEESGVASLPTVTIHQLFEDSVQKYGDHVALATKHGDQWNKLTYKQYYEQCRIAAKGFLKVCCYTSCKNASVLICTIFLLFFFSFYSFFKYLKLGLQRYHGVGILGFNSAEWFISDIGAILAG